MKIARNWNNLSDGFRKIYLEATEIPDNFTMFRSPGYGIEIYYTDDGDDAPDLTDEWCADSSDWREKKEKSNGIPDYIDEVAFAIDSAWSMEIERFGFLPPLPYISDDYTSDNYKIIIESLDGDYYGLTYPAGPEPDSGTGFRSMVSIRNEWEGWDINDIIDYETHPEKGIHITCAHEFFHAVQYRMALHVDDEVYLDDFPVSWLEGTAVMMEELAYPEVNDFTQYSDNYFKRPSRFTVFGRDFDDDIYSNTLICLYLYNKVAQASDRIGFFRSIFTENMTDVITFDSLLYSTLKKQDRTWVDVLNSFHAASFFTGENAAEDMFLDDASELPSLTYTSGDGDLNKSLTKTIKPWSVQYTSCLRDVDDDSTLYISVTPPATAGSDEFAIRYIFNSDDSAMTDTIIAAEYPDTGVITGKFKTWKKWNEVIVVVSNGRISDDLEIKIQFSHQPPADVIVPRFSPVVTDVGNSSVRRYLLNGRSLPVDGKHIETIRNAGGEMMHSGIAVEKNRYGTKRILNVR